MLTHRAEAKSKEEVVRRSAEAAGCDRQEDAGSEGVRNRITGSLAIDNWWDREYEEEIISQVLCQRSGDLPS